MFFNNHLHLQAGPLPDPRFLPPGLTIGYHNYSPRTLFVNSTPVASQKDGAVYLLKDLPEDTRDALRALLRAAVQKQLAEMKKEVIRLSDEIMEIYNASVSNG